MLTSDGPPLPADPSNSDSQPEQDRPPMSSKSVRCDIEGCAEAAVYKIAAPWSDGIFTELKTFGFACPDHIGAVFRGSEDRRKHYVPRPGENVGEIGIYKYEPGKRDKQLQRLSGLEENYRS
jgi:hypothetical protein